MHEIFHELLTDLARSAIVFALGVCLGAATLYGFVLLTFLLGD